MIIPSFCFVTNLIIFISAGLFKSPYEAKLNNVLLKLRRETRVLDNQFVENVTPDNPNNPR